MATTNFYIKQGDRLPSIQATLQDGKGVAVPLTSGVTSVTFRMRWSTVIKSGPAVIVDAANGVVRYDWAVGDTDRSAVYSAEFEVLWAADGKRETYPNQEYITVHVTDDLG